MYERSYHSKVLKSDKIPKEKKVNWLNRPFPWQKFFWTFGILVFLGIVIYLIREPRFQITEVYIEGTEVVDSEEVSNFVKNSLEGSYLYFLPRTSILLSNVRKVKREVVSAFPRFEDIEVKRHTLSSLSVEIKEYQAKYIWCDNECSFMNKNGVVFASAPYFSGDAYLKIYIGEIDRYPFIPITKSEIEMIENIVDKLNAINISLTEFHFESDRKLDILFVHNNHASHIYIDPTKDIETTLEALYTGLRTMPLSGMFKDESKRLEYLDLRFSDKVVYKFD